MGFFDKVFDKDVLLPVGLAVGGTALGSFLFPETFGSITGGLLGSSSTAAPAVGAEVASNSVFSNPSVLSAGILAGTSLLSNLFGSSDQEELAQQTLAENQRQFDEELALKRESLAQALEIAKLQAGGAGSGAAAARDAALRTAKMQVIGQAAGLKSQALQIPLAARSKQADMAQNTGVQSGMFFNSLIPNLQRPALQAAT